LTSYSSPAFLTIPHKHPSLPLIPSKHLQSTPCKPFFLTSDSLPALVTIPPKHLASSPGRTWELSKCYTLDLLCTQFIPDMRSFVGC